MQESTRDVSERRWRCDAKTYRQSFAVAKILARRSTIVGQAMSPQHAPKSGMRSALLPKEWPAYDAGRGWLRNQGSGASSTSQAPRLPGSRAIFQRGPSSRAASAPPTMPPMWPLRHGNARVLANLVWLCCSWLSQQGGDAGGAGASRQCIIYVPGQHRRAPHPACSRDSC